MDNGHTVSLDLTVHEMLAECPGTAAVFRRFDIDTCCGGGVPIRAAAERDGVDLEALRQALADELAAHA
jgi:regulator of cell morphogenesis and NO signaling